jgi:hypothetical protein
MSGAFPESIVTDYEHLVAAMRIDPKDRHVAAAAVKVGAQVVVTDNISASTGSRSRARVQSRDAREGYMLRVKQLECLGVGGARVSRLRAGVDRDRTLRRSHQSRSAQ